MQAGAAADDQDNYQSLPLEDRLVHKVQSGQRDNQEFFNLLIALEG